MPTQEQVTTLQRYGWRQGAFLPGAIVEHLRKTGWIPQPSRYTAPHQRAKFSRPWVRSQVRRLTQFLWPGGTVASETQTSSSWMVLSHDCDINNSSLDAEPTIELIRVETVVDRALDGNLQWGKNPRRYQIVDEQGGVRVCYEAEVHDRVCVPRECLAMCGPDSAPHLSTESVQRICGWVARRYVRSAFPDAFNARTRLLVQALRKRLKSGGEFLTGLYVLVTDDELDSDQVYDIALWATMRDGDYDDPKKRSIAQSIVDYTESLFQGCKGVGLKETELRPERDVSISDQRLLKRWDFDYLSLKDSPLANIPPNP